MALVVLCAGCGDGTLVTLGDGRTTSPGTAVVRRVPELSSVDQSDNPTLTGDLLEIYFTSKRSGGTGDEDIWFATRGSVSEPFGTPEPISIINSDGFESSSAIDAGGTTLWFASRRDGGTGGVDIWVSTRAARGLPWSEPINAADLNSDADDIPRPPGQGGLVMPLASRRDGERYRTYLAARDRLDGAFGPAVLLSELAPEADSVVDAFLSADGLVIVFNAITDGNDDLYVARRASTTATFSAGVPLTALNTEHDERDPWLSPDGARLYFSSDRDGPLNIYEADVESLGGLP